MPCQAESYPTSRIFENVSENGSPLAGHHVSLTPGGGPRAPGLHLLPVARAAVQPSGLVEQSGALSGHMNWWSLGSAVPGHLPAPRFLSKWEWYRNANFQKVLLAWSNTFRRFTICLWVISLFYISTICRHTERHKYK